MMRKLFTSQRGAMFGLDARVAMAIMGGLSIIAGSAYILSARQAEAHALQKEAELTHAAVDALQFDTKRAIQRIITNFDSYAESAKPAALYRLLFEPYNVTANLRYSWNGPYLQSNHSNFGHQTTRYGNRGLHIGTATSATAACTSNCFIWMSFGEVSSTSTLEELNRILDGDEGTPATSGKVRWQASGSSNILYVRLMDAMR